MSRHYFETQYQNRAVQVVLGYDRPLNYFHLTIMYAEPVTAEDTIPADEDDPIVYSNLDDPAAGFLRDLVYYRAKLMSLGITVPESMFRETEQDALHRVGKRLVQHHQDGRLDTIG